MFKFAVLIAIIGCMQAVELDDMSIPEGNEIVKEHIMLDKQRGIQTYHTGKHCGRAGVTEMIDSNHGFVVTKLDHDLNDRSEKVCAISKYDPKIDMNPNSASRSLKIANKTMPNEVDEFKKYFLPEDFPGKDLLPEGIKSFCGDLQIVKAVEVDFNNLEELNKLALNMALAAKKRRKKRAIVKEFTACTNESTMKIMTCDATSLYCRCKIRRNSCTYKINCPLDLNSGGFNCKGLHKFNSMICCDYNC